MCRPWQISAIVILILAVDGGIESANAQFRGAGLRPGAQPGLASAVDLAAMAPVQKEIGLDAEAVTKINEISKSYVREFQEQMAEAGFPADWVRQLQALTPDERSKKMLDQGIKRTAITEALNAKYDRHVKDALSAEQYERVQQIRRQLAGSLGLFADRDLAEALKLSNQQRQAIQRVNQDYWMATRNRVGGEGANARPTAAENLASLRERDAKAVEFLSKEQQEKYAELIGKPFDLSQLPMLRGAAAAPGVARQPANEPEGAARRRAGPPVIDLSLPAGSPVVTNVLSFCALPPVQKEISLTPEGAEKLRQISEAREREYREEFEQSFGAASYRQLQSLPEEERAAKRRQMAEKRNEIQKRLDEKIQPKIHEVLSPTQYDRVQQIARQTVGCQLLIFDLDLVNALNVSREQQEKIATIIRETMQKQLDDNPRGRVGETPAEVQARLTHMLDLNKKRDAMALEVLSEPQRAKYIKLLGPPVDMLPLMEARLEPPRTPRRAPGGDNPPQQRNNQNIK